MAVVAITNIYEPTPFARRTQEAQTALNRFIQSGVAVMDPALQAEVEKGGRTGELVNYNPLATGEPTYGSDNPASSSTPKNIGHSIQKYRLAPRNESWSTMDLARQIALEDPVGAITGRIGHFWARDDEQRIIYSLLGILADNEANDSSDMVVDVATDDAAAVTDAERISSERIIDALQTLGDHKDSITTLAIHSSIHTRLQKQNLIDYIRDADNNLMFEQYLGKRLIVDDSLPAVAGGNRITYTCVMFASGVIAGANGRVETPSELERLPSAGDGAGQDIIHSRVSNVWHPVGLSFESAAVNGNGGQANYSDLQNATNWNRIHDRKNIPLAFIQVND